MIYMLAVEGVLLAQEVMEETQPKMAKLVAAVAEAGMVIILVLVEMVIA
jgi:hypothetical protein